MQKTFLVLLHYVVRPGSKTETGEFVNEAAKK
jgi:hypothetical protein